MFNSHILSPKKLQKIIDGKETPKIDFKQKIDTTIANWREELCKDIIAIANGNKGTAKQYGYLIFGVSDKKNPKTGKRDLFEVEDPINDKNESDFYDTLQSICNPYPEFSRDIVELEVLNHKKQTKEIKKILVYSIKPSKILYRLKRDLSGKNVETAGFRENCVLVRREDGEKTEVASPELIKDLERERKGFLNFTFSSILLCSIILILLIIIVIFKFNSIPNNYIPNSIENSSTEYAELLDNNLVESNQISNNSPVNLISAKLINIFDLHHPWFKYMYKIEVVLQKKNDTKYNYYGEIRTGFTGEPESVFFTLPFNYNDAYMRERFSALTGRNLFIAALYCLSDFINKDSDFKTIPATNLTATTLTADTQAIYIFSGQKYNSTKDIKYIQFRLRFSADETLPAYNWNYTKWYPIDISSFKDKTLDKID